jgi:hypothetical protein
MQTGGVFIYEAWCPECMKVTRHDHGDCLVCHPVGFPRPAVVPTTEES